MSAVTSTDERSSNFILRLWRGQVSLAKTYWLFGVLFGVIIRVASPGVTYLIFSNNEKLSAFDITALTDGWLVFIIAYSLFISVAIWRSANIYALEKPTKKANATLARVAVVLGILSLLGSLARLATDANIEPKNNDQALQFDMMIAGLNKGLPKKIDNVTTLTKIDLKGTDFLYYYFIDPKVADKPKLATRLEASVTKTTCDNKDMFSGSGAGIVYNYIYSDAEQANFARIRVARTSCP